MLESGPLPPGSAPANASPGAAPQVSPPPPTIWRYLRRYPLMVWRGSLGGLGYNTLIVAGPILLGRALDSILALEQGFTPEALSRLYLNLALLVLATALFQGLRTVKRWDFRRMSNRVGTDLQYDLLDSTLRWPLARLARERVGDLMSRAVGDAQVVAETLMTTITELYDTFVLMVAYFVVLMFYAPGLTLICSIPAPLTAVASHYAGAAVFRRATEARVAASGVNSHLQETLTGVRVLRLFGREPEERRRLEALCREQLRANLAVTLLQSGLMPLYAAIASLGVVAVIGAGGQRVVAGTWTVGAFTAYLTMFLAMTTRTLMAARVLNRLHAGRAGWARIKDKLEQPRGPSLPEKAPAAGPGGRPAGVRGADLRIRRLTFSYPGESRPVLEDLDLDLAPGSLTCVTGQVGSGKSALAAALTGLYPYEGSITLDGLELSGLTDQRRLATISFAGQNPLLFSDTVENNVTFGGEAAEGFERAIRGAALDGDVGAFSGGWRTLVGERGVQVSGGQRQRIALARAIYAGPSLLVLDDPFSAVDIGTESRLVTGLREAAGGATIVVFSHRLTAFPHADQVVLLDGGRVAAAGTHGQLLAGQQVYRRIYEAQVWLEQNEPSRSGGSGP